MAAIKLKVLMEKFMLKLYCFQSNWVKGGFSFLREQNQVAASERAESHPAEPLVARRDGGSTRVSVFARTVLNGKPLGDVSGLVFRLQT